MHILVVTTVHVPTDARILHRQVRALLDAGHRVTVAGPWRATGARPPDDVGAIELPRAAGRRRLAALLAARKLLAAASRDVDLVVIHDPELLMAVGLTRLRAPVVWDVHEDLGSSLGDKRWLPGPLVGLARSGVAVVERWAERRVHLLLAEDAYAQRFERAHPVAHNVPWECPLVPRSPERRAVYVGRVSAGRGAHELIEVGRLLQPHGIGLVVVGPADREVREDIVQADRDGVLSWRGYLPNPEALALLEGASVGLSLLRDQPNYRHSMPTKVLEYMERGLPVVTTPLPLSRRVVEVGRCGAVVPFGDAAAAAEAVRVLCDDPKAQQEQAVRARAAAVERYTWQHEAPAFVRQLEQWAAAGQTR